MIRLAIQKNEQKSHVTHKENRNYSAIDDDIIWFDLFWIKRKFPYTQNKKKTKERRRISFPHFRIVPAGLRSGFFFFHSQTTIEAESLPYPCAVCVV